MENTIIFALCGLVATACAGPLNNPEEPFGTPFEPSSGLSDPLDSLGRPEERYNEVEDGFSYPSTLQELEQALDEMFAEMPEQEVVDMVEVLLHEADDVTVRAVVEAAERRVTRSAYGGCQGDAAAGHALCQYLRGLQQQAAAGAVHPSSASQFRFSFTSSVVIPPAPVRVPDADSGSDSGSETAGRSGLGGAAAAAASVQLEPSYSHDTCLPPVTHVVREAVEYLPRTVYNTQHLILPSTRVLTMVETEAYPRPVYVTVTTVLPQHDSTVTSTAVQYEEKTLDVNQPRYTDVQVQSTKLHIFTDTKDYFWTKTTFQPYYQTVTTTILSDVPQDYSHEETRTVDHTVYVTTTAPHTITETSTVLVPTRKVTTVTAHQYRYVAVTPVPVTETKTVTNCYGRR